MELAKYKACICEGSAENAIMDILLDNDLLIFTREEMLEEEVIRCRDGKRFEEKYLRKGFLEKISVIRILDSRRENFKLSKAYEHKVDVINVITAPEIEMLIIFNEDKYKEFKKSGKKPSDFCKEDLKMTSVKSYRFVKDYFSDPDILLAAIKKYYEMSKIRKGEYTLLPVPKANDETIYLYCKGSGASAKGFVSAGGFTVLEGSTVSDHTVPSLETKGKSYYNLRNALIKDGTISDRVFTRDYEFKAPSAASAVILGHTSNGNADWKTADRTKLKDL